MTQLSQPIILVGITLKPRHNTKTQPEQQPSQHNIQNDLNELQQLCITAGLEPKFSTHQKINKYSAATLIGAGKIQTLKQLADTHEAKMVVIDHHLTGSQIRNLEKILERRVITRSQLIIDIFAARARTHEGKLQVELARLLDELPRQIGGWHGSLSRLAGGIGTRGPGEAALEIGRRRIREKIKQIKKKLQHVRAHRERLREKRSHRPSLALIGYTSAGKSTLLNKLTGAKVLTHNKLFATLDPTTRSLHLGPTDVYLTDTVGFIRQLPTHLIEAFKATLEESQSADILLHVIDMSHPQCDQQAEKVQELVHDLGWQDKPMVLVLNKCDALNTTSPHHSQSGPCHPIAPFLQQHKGPYVFVSAQTGQGLDELKKTCLQCVQKLQHQVELYFPHHQQDRLFELQQRAHVTQVESHSRGTLCQALLNVQQIQKWKKFINTSVTSN